jgi:hypothetical protein
MFHQVDWFGTFLPAALCLFSGCHVESFFNPPWTVFPLLPFALLPTEVAVPALWFTQIAVYVAVAYRLGGNWLSAVALMLSPFVLGSMATGNVEWLVLLGFLMPRRYGILFLAIKPQMTFLVILWWLWEARNDLVGFLKPLAVVSAACFILYGNWVGQLLSYSQGHVAAQNRSLYPLGLVVSGAVLIWFLARSRRAEWLMTASPFAMPFITLTAWTGSLVPLICHPRLFLITLPIQWVIVLLVA